MRFKKGMVVAVVLLIASGGFRACRHSSGPVPTLVFRGYANSVTQACAVAKLEFKNPSSRDAWLQFSGPDFPLNPPWIEPATRPSPLANPANPMVYSVGAGSFFQQGIKVRPGETLRLEYPMRPGDVAKQIGLACSLGRFSDGNEFVLSLSTPALNQGSSWWQKVAYWGKRWRGKIRLAPRHDIWCEERLCYSNATAQLARQNSAQPANGTNHSQPSSARP